MRLLTVLIFQANYTVRVLRVRHSKLSKKDPAVGVREVMQYHGIPQQHHHCAQLHQEVLHRTAGQLDVIAVLFLVAIVTQEI